MSFSLAHLGGVVALIICAAYPWAADAVSPSVPTAEIPLRLEVNDCVVTWGDNPVVSLQLRNNSTKPVMIWRLDVTDANPVLSLAKEGERPSPMSRGRSSGNAGWWKSRREIIQLDEGESTSIVIPLMNSIGSVGSIPPGAYRGEWTVSLVAGTGTEKPKNLTIHTQPFALVVKEDPLGPTCEAWLRAIEETDAIWRSATGSEAELRAKVISHMRAFADRHQESALASSIRHDLVGGYLELAAGIREAEDSRRMAVRNALDLLRDLDSSDRIGKPFLLHDYERILRACMRDESLRRERDLVIDRLLLLDADNQAAKAARRQVSPAAVAPAADPANPSPPVPPEPPRGTP